MNDAVQTDPPSTSRLDFRRWRGSVTELFIVVVGILIALAVDDWYAGVQQRDQEVAWVTSIRDDLAADRTTLEDGLSFLDETRNVIRDLIETLDDPSYVVADTLGYLRQIKRATLATYFRPTATTYTELTASGGLSVISSRLLTRAVIDYHESARLTEDLNEIVQRIRWDDYSDALAEVIEPTILSALTEDVYRQADQWPPAAAVSLPTSSFPNLDRLRSSPEFRTALARSLDAVAVQYGDLYRMLTANEHVLRLANDEAARLTG